MAVRVSILAVLLLEVIVVSLGQHVHMPAAPPVNKYGHIQSSHCRFLVNAPAAWGVNAAPFKISTRSHSGLVRRGHPIEVAILPTYEMFRFMKFTDFALWAEPATPPATAYTAALPVPGAAATAMPAPVPLSHIGIWQVVRNYSGGAEGMKCSSASSTQDTVGSFAGRMLELMKAQFPTYSYIQNMKPSARHGCAFLWYPDQVTMAGAQGVKFVAKLKAMGAWFELESDIWTVFRPPPPPPRITNNPSNYNNMMERTVEMAENMARMQRRLDRAI